ncbi:MAG: GntR family transcriptional regulator [Paracoccaceae bacterium]
MSLLAVPVEPTLAEAAYAALKTDLMTGAHLPGERLSIRTLAQARGTGTAPMREALKRLASERVLEGSAKRSYAVPVLDAKRAGDLFNLRGLLECEAAIQAMPAMDDALLAELEATIQPMREAAAAGRLDAYMVENHRFHFLIYARCDNPDMIAVIERLWMQTGPSLRAGLGASEPDASWPRAHHAIVAALRQGSQADLRSHLLEDIRWDWLEDAPT